MSVINFRKMLELLKDVDNINQIQEGKMNQLSLEIEEWVSDAFERHGHQVGGRDRSLMMFRKKFGGAWEKEFIRRWNEAEIGERPDEYLMNSVEEEQIIENPALLGLVGRAAMGAVASSTVKNFLSNDDKDDELEEAGFSNARPGENYTEEQRYADDEMALEYAQDEGMDWLRSKEGQMYLMNWIESETDDEKEGSLEDLISSLQHVMVMGAYNTIGIDIEISTIETEKFLGEWMKANGMTQITQESLDDIYEAGKNIDEGVDRERVEAEGKKAAAEGHARRCPINYRQFSQVDKAWLKGYDSHKAESDIDEKSLGLNSGAWNRAEDSRYTKYDPPQTGNKNVSARKGFVG